MREVKLQFLAFEGCPLAPKALRQLERAAQQLARSVNLSIERVDLLAPATPDSLVRWGSPTILLNGRDISGAAPGDANSCRIYTSAGGVLSAEEIIEAISAAPVTI
jgi:hypothetical protein